MHLEDDSSEGASPILLLDDVFAELDTARRSRLGEIVASAEQVLVTCAVHTDIPDALRQGMHLVKVSPATAEAVDASELTLPATEARPTYRQPGA